MTATTAADVVAVAPTPDDAVNREGAERVAQDERPIGETVSRLVGDGKAYARAELDLARARLDARLVRFRAVALFGAAALLFAIGALIALAMTAVLTLAGLLGPLGGGLAATLLIAAVSGLFAYLAKARWDRGND